MGVHQSEITITYRFSEPNEPAALVMPRSHWIDSRSRQPELKTLGDHPRRSRLILKLLQVQVAEQLGVHEASVCNWETNRSKPNLEYLPAIIRFLEYYPQPPPETVSDGLVRFRTVRGMSQRQAAQQLGADPSTLASRERGEREPTGAFCVRVARFLAHCARGALAAQLNCEPHRRVTKICLRRISSLSRNTNPC